MLDAIRIVPDAEHDALHLLSRINYARLYTIATNTEVQSFGTVHTQSLALFELQFRSVHYPTSESRYYERRATKEEAGEEDEEEGREEGEEGEEGDKDRKDEEFSALFYGDGWEQHCQGSGISETWQDGEGKTQEADREAPSNEKGKEDDIRDEDEAKEVEDNGDKNGQDEEEKDEEDEESLALFYGDNWLTYCRGFGILGIQQDTALQQGIRIIGGIGEEGHQQEKEDDKKGDDDKVREDKDQEAKRESESERDKYSVW